MLLYHLAFWAATVLGWATLWFAAAAYRADPSRLKVRHQRRAMLCLGSALLLAAAAERQHWIRTPLQEIPATVISAKDESGRSLSTGLQVRTANGTLAFSIPYIVTAFRPGQRMQLTREVDTGFVRSVRTFDEEGRVTTDFRQNFNDRAYLEAVFGVMAIAFGLRGFRRAPECRP